MSQRGCMELHDGNFHSDGSFSILMLPWLGHGHLSPFLELAKKLAERNFRIYVCSTPVNLMSIRSKNVISSEFSDSIQLVELHLPSLPDLPPHLHTTNGLPPHLMTALKTAFDMSRTNFFSILQNLKPNLLIYDFLQPWAAQAAASLDIPSLLFFPNCAAMTCFALYYTQYDSTSAAQFPFPEIYLLRYERPNFINLLQSSANGVRDVDRVVECINRSCGSILIKSFIEIESKYINYLSELTAKKVILVGPLVDHRSTTKDVDNPKMELITEWMDKKSPSSTVFVSFGTEYFLSKEERFEIAQGLELCGVNFIWVVRVPIGENFEAKKDFPDGFFERVGDRGLILEGWVSQIKILEHPSIGGFVSHCGWSSVMEAMKLGVPIITMPMHLDQPVNSRLLKALGVGLLAEKDENGRIQKETLAKAIEEVVGGGICGEDVRNRASALSELIRIKGDSEIDVVVEELVQLCGQRRDVQLGGGEC